MLCKVHGVPVSWRILCYSEYNYTRGGFFSAVHVLFIDLSLMIIESGAALQVVSLAQKPRRSSIIQIQL